MFRKDLLHIIRPTRDERLAYATGVEERGVILSGAAHSPSGETYRIGHGYLDLMRGKIGAHNPANLTNFLPGAGRLYEPLWRVRSLTLLTGERFPNEREVEIVASLAGIERGGLYLDLGCSAGLYTRHLQRVLGDSGAVVGIDIAPTMLREAARRARCLGVTPSFARADMHHLPFADASFAGAVCGGTLNEAGDPARALRETRRVLAPGARLAIMGILRSATARGRRLQRLLSTGGLKFFHPDELNSLLDHAGFDADSLQTYSPVFFAGATRR
ncbi:MAG: class I SAM-dependent methyltransferase [Actinomycetota bacterium]